MKNFLALSLSDVLFITLINVKMPTIVGILTFMSRINFVLSRVEHEKEFTTSRPGLSTIQLETPVSAKKVLDQANCIMVAEKKDFEHKILIACWHMV